METVDRVVGNMRMCWNPGCHYGWIEGTRTQCMKCGWSSTGAPSAKQPGAVVQARGSTEERDRGMNKNEERYDKHLRGELRAGRIVSYKFESMKLRLADSTFYTPDFLVIDCDGFIELHDAKAKWKGEKGPHIEDDAAVKLKVVAEQYPWFRIKAVWEDAGVWQVRDY